MKIAEPAALSDEQVGIVETYLIDTGIGQGYLFNELLDHLCCDLEMQMVGGDPFDQCWEQLKIKIPKEHLKHLEFETQLNYNKSFNDMKRLMLISGGIASVGLISGSFFKVMHWPGANILTVLGGAVLALLFLPSYFNYLYRKQQVQRNKLMYLFAFLGPFLGSMGFIGKSLHWQWATYLSITGLVFLAIGFIPLYLYRSLKTSEDRAGSLAMVMVLLISIPIIFMVINPKPSSRLSESIAEIARRDQQMASIFGRKNSEGYFTLRTLAREDSSLLTDAEILSLTSDALVEHIEGLSRQVYSASVGWGKLENEASTTNLMMYAQTNELLFDQQGAALLFEKLKNYQLLVDRMNKHLGREYQSPTYVKSVLGEENGWAQRQFTDKALIDVKTYFSMLQTSIRATEAETLQRMILQVKYKDHPMAEIAGI